MVQFSQIGFNLSKILKKIYSHINFLKKQVFQNLFKFDFDFFGLTFEFVGRKGNSTIDRQKNAKFTKNVLAFLFQNLQSLIFLENLRVFLAYIFSPKFVIFNF